MVMRKRYNSSEDQVLVEMDRAGFDAYAITAKTGRTPASVRCRLSALKGKKA